MVIQGVCNQINYSSGTCWPPHDISLSDPPVLRLHWDTVAISSIALVPIGSRTHTTWQARAVVRVWRKDLLLRSVQCSLIDPLWMSKRSSIWHRWNSTINHSVSFPGKELTNCLYVTPASTVTLRFRLRHASEYISQGVTIIFWSDYIRLTLFWPGLGLSGAQPFSRGKHSAPNGLVLTKDLLFPLRNYSNWWFSDMTTAHDCI